MRGFVLLTMLVYLQIFSLLAVQAMASMVFHQKMLHRRLVADNGRLSVLSVLARIDSTHEPSCTVTVKPPAYLSTRGINWWRRHACLISAEEFDYFYVRESLGTDDCGVITNQSNQDVMPIYYRNTLLQVSKVTQPQRLLVQDTIVLPGSTPPSCSGNLKQVKPGRQMLRWL